jgi:hypothetical protein
MLGSRTGTEIYVRDLAIALARRGHSPIVYSPLLGPIADEIRSHTIPVTADLRSISEKPDVIHGNHALETLAALLAFPETPAVGVCHSWIGWADEPLDFPRIIRYVAVDLTCRDRLRSEHGVPDDRIDVVLNSVDLERFRKRSPLPAKPHRALVFSNGAGPNSPHFPAISAACAAAGIDVEVAGSSSGNSVARPEQVLGEYDLVFAKAKAALEAMSVGAAVLLCDVAGAGPMVTSANVLQLRPLNFGVRTLRQPLEADYLRTQIELYDPKDAEAVSRIIRESAGIDTMTDQLCAIYTDVIAEWNGRSEKSADDEARAASRYLQSVAPRLYEAEILDLAAKASLRRPLIRALAKFAAKSPRRAWLRDLLEKRGVT